MELKLMIPAKIGKLKWNKEEIEAAVKSKIENYKGLIYTEDSLQQAKKDRAELNNLKKAIIERKRKVKSTLLQPYEEFEEEVQGVIDLIEKQSNEIDKTIKQFEKDEKQQKKNEIRKIFSELVGDDFEVLDFEAVFDERYLNKSFSMKKIKEEISSKVENLKKDIDCIKNIDSKYKNVALSLYLREYDLNSALNEIARLEKMDHDENTAKLSEEQTKEETREESEKQTREESEEQTREETPEQTREETPERIGKETSEQTKEETQEKNAVNSYIHSSSKKYFMVTFRFSEDVFCTNIVHALNEKAVYDEYADYSWVDVKQATEEDVEDAKRKGMPFNEIDSNEFKAMEITRETHPVEQRKPLNSKKDSQSDIKFTVNVQITGTLDELAELSDYAKSIGLTLENMILQE